MSYITTISGINFDPMDPDPALIRIEDIAHSLAHICRGNGHVKEFHSVAQHCLECAEEARTRGYTDRVVMGCLLHDASEAYLSDVTRPIKGLLTEYLRAEERLQDMIWERFMGTVPDEEEQRLIFGVDDDILSLEFKQNMAAEPGEGYKNIKADIRCCYRDISEVRADYLREFERLNGKKVK